MKARRKANILHCSVCLCRFDFAFRLRFFSRLMRTSQTACGQLQKNRTNNGAASENGKSNPGIKKCRDEISAIKHDDALIPSPSLAGITVIVKQAVLLTLAHRSPTPSQALSPVASCRFAPHYSGGTVSAFHRSSLLSPEGHLFQFVIKFFSNLLQSLCFVK